MGYLCGGVQGHVAAEGLRHRNDGSWFHRHWDQTLLYVAFRDNEGSLIDGFLAVAIILFNEKWPRVAGICSEFVVNDYIVGQRRFEVNYRTMHVVVDINQLDRIMGDRVGFGQHAGNAVADIGDFRDRKRIVRRVLHVVGDRPSARHRSGPLVRHVGPRVDAVYSGQCQGR